MLCTTDREMSESRHGPKPQLEQIWSAPPQTADIDSSLEDFSVGRQKRSFDHVVSEGDELVGNFKAKDFGGLEIDP